MQYQSLSPVQPRMPSPIRPTQPVVCRSCGEPITLTRLVLDPASRRCTACALEARAPSPFSPPARSRAPAAGER